MSAAGNANSSNGPPASGDDVQESVPRKKCKDKGCRNAIWNTLRRLTPPKLNIHKTQKVSDAGGGKEEVELGSGISRRAHFSPASSSDHRAAAAVNGNHDGALGRAASNSPSSSERSCAQPDGTPRFFCPALNCSRKLRASHVMDHAMAEHCPVLSDLPDGCSNSIEVSESDLSSSLEAAAWAPTLMTAFGQQFFFETWRDADGKWSMWVYHLEQDDQSEQIHAELEIYNDDLRLSFCGPVHSLRDSPEKITTEGRCLSFGDALARSLLQSLGDGTEWDKGEDEEEDGGGEGTTGICYRVKLRRGEIRETTNF